MAHKFFGMIFYRGERGGRREKEKINHEFTRTPGGVPRGQIKNGHKRLKRAQDHGHRTTDTNKDIRESGYHDIRSMDC